MQHFGKMFALEASLGLISLPQKRKKRKKEKKERNWKHKEWGRWCGGGRGSNPFCIPFCFGALYRLCSLPQNQTELLCILRPAWTFGANRASWPQFKSVSYPSVVSILLETPVHDPPQVTRISKLNLHPSSLRLKSFIFFVYRILSLFLFEYFTRGVLTLLKRMWTMKLGSP